jgi:DHA2 family methylenomycin A resistance protein-like MFS transporter
VTGRPARGGWIVAATSLGFVVVQLDVTIVNVALPRMGADLGGGVALLQWVVDAYALAFAALLLSGGTTGDRHGARRPYIAGFAIFGLASLACGLAPSPGELLAARAAQGVGAALLVPTSLALLNHAFEGDSKARAWAVGWWTAAGGVAIAAGPVAGGLLLEAFGWRSIFLVNLPVCAVAIAMALRLPDTDAPASRRIDWAGQALAVVALGGITLAVIEARPLGPAHPLVLGAAVAGLVAAIAFPAVERRVAEPMLPLDMFSARGFSSAVIFGLIVNLAFYGIVFVLTLYLQQVRGYDAAHAGFAFLPLMATVIGANVASGRLTGRTGSRAPMLTGAIAAAAGYAMLLWLGDRSSYFAMLPAFVVIPLGMGLAVPAMTTSVLASVERERAGIGTAALNAARQTGGVIGVAAFGALLGPSRIVGGMHAASLAAVGLLLGAAVVAWRGVPAAHNGARRSKTDSRDLTHSPSGSPVT